MKDLIVAPRPGLVRALGPVLATAVVVGTVIGSGIFKKPQQVSESLPFFGLAASVWVLGGLLALLGALSLAEIAVLYPRAGGNYVFLREGYGRLAGFLFGWVEFCIIRSASIGALATIFTESLGDVLGNPAFQQRLGLELGSTPLGYWPQKGLTAAVILELAVVNVLGVRWGGLLQLFITLIKVGSLLAIAVLPFVIVALVQPGPEVPRPQSSYLNPVWPSWDQFNLSAFGAALVGVLWAYHGWMNAAPIAEEIRRPQRNIPLALLGGVGIIIVLYLGANLGYYLIIPQPEIAGIKNTTVVKEFSLRLLGPIGAAAASAAVMCSVFGALNGNLLVGPRLLYAMGEDGLAPRSLGAVHPRFRTPALAILVLAFWAVGLVLGAAVLTETGILSRDKNHFDVLTDFAIFGSVTFETLAVSTIFVFRRRLPDVERPYRCLGYPVVPALYVLLMALVLINMFFKQRLEALTGMGFIAVGAFVYYVFGMKVRRQTQDTL
jgi:amino acid transporter